MYDELVVKRLWECASGECFNCSQYTETTNASVCSKELMKQAADAIEELQAAEKKYLANISALEIENQHLKRERDWIPVTERLPKEGEFVLVRGDLYPNKAYGCDVAVSRRLDWNYWQGFGRERDIKHWMPLPKPPKEGE